MMDRIEQQSIPAARVLVDALPWLIEQAEAGKLALSAFMLRSALTEARKLVHEAEGRCGRIASTTDFLRHLGEETA